MILCRTSNHKRRSSLSFLTTQGQQSALLAQLEKQSWIDEIFNRTLPIPLQYATRFGPPGFGRNVFYASKKRETTFFEFGYSLLKFQSILGRGVSAVCFEVKFQRKQKPMDVRAAKNRAAILDPKSYRAAHLWIAALSSIPESVRYPSVREPAGGGINFAIYNPSAVATTRAEVEDLVLTPRADGSVDVESITRGRLPAIRPIR